MATRSSTGKAATTDSEELTAAPPTATAEPDQAAADKPGPIEPAEHGTAYLNVSGGPLVFDKDGHQVDDGAWTPPVNLDAVGQRARAMNFLLPRSAL